MITWQSWETIPFHFVWISLTLLYGFRVWPMRATLVVLGFVMAPPAVSIGLDAFNGIQLWGELFEVPLMAAMFLAMVWHARRRVDALRVAEGRAEERRSLLERQERFVHDASHELRTPLTIARGHLELLRHDGHERAELDVALDELGRIDAIIERLLAARRRRSARLPALDRRRARVVPRGRVRALVGGRAAGVAARPAGGRAPARRRRTGCARRSTRCSRTPSSSHARRDAIELRARP